MAATKDEMDLIEDIRCYVMDMIPLMGDQIPKTDSNHFLLHQKPGQPPQNPYGFNGVTFRSSDNVYTMVATPNPTTDASQDGGFTAHLTQHRDDQVHYVGKVTDLTRTMRQQNEVLENARGIGLSIRYNPRARREEYRDIAGKQIIRNQDLAASLVYAHTSLGIEPPKSATNLAPWAMNAAPA